MTVPRVLLLTRTPPGAPSVGGLYLGELCSYYPKEAISCFAVTPSGRSTGPDFDWLPIAHARLPRPWLYQGLGPLVRRAVRFWSRRYVRMCQVPVLASRAVEFARRQGVEMVWAALSPPIMVSIVKEVVSVLEVPLVTTIWDPPEMQMLMYRPAYDRLAKREVLRDFGDVLRMSNRCGVASDRMGEAYKRLYGVESVVMILGVGSRLRHLPAVGLNHEDQFVLGYAGGWRTPEEWEAVFSALSACDWRIAGREVIVRVLSNHVTLRGEGKRHVEFLGWRSVKETVDVMSQTDVGYVPYWFDERYSLSVRFCFPGKVTTYLAAGRPILYHGPRDSSVVDFLERFPVGLCCHSLDEADIIEVLGQLINDGAIYVRTAQASQVALDQELSAEVFRKRFATLMGVRENDLLPVDGGR